MKLKNLVAILLFGSSITAFAQGYKDGIEFYKVGQYENAKELLNRNLDAADTNKSQSYCYLGQIAVIEGNLTAAKDYFDKGVAADANDAYNQVGLGWVNLKNGQAKLAEENFKAARNLAKKDPKVETAIARAYYNADASVYAKQIKSSIEKARKYNAQDPDSYILEGDMYAAKNAPGDAAGQYELAFTYDQNNTEAYVKYAKTYSAVVPKMAIETLKGFVDRNPNSALTQRELADLYYRLDLGGLATAAYKKYLENPNHFKQDEVRCVQLMFFAGNYQESYDLATALTKKLAADDKDNFYMKRMQLYNLVALKKYPEAEVAGEELFKMTNYGLTFETKDFTDYAEALKENGKADLSVAQYEKAFELNPTKTDLMRDLSDAYTEAKQYHKAAKAYQKIIDSGNYKANDLFVISGVYTDLATNTEDEAEKKAAFAKAREYAKQADEKVPGNYRIVQQRATVEFLDGNKEQAVKYYEEELKLLNEKENAKVEYKSTFVRVYGVLAQIAIENKDLELAKSYYIKWLDVDPSNEKLREYVETLK